MTKKRVPDFIVRHVQDVSAVVTVACYYQLLGQPDRSIRVTLREVEALQSAEYQFDVTHDGDDIILSLRPRKQ